MLDSDLGILRSARVFQHMESPEYVLCVQVWPHFLPVAGQLSLPYYRLCPLVVFFFFFSLLSKPT